MGNSNQMLKSLFMSETRISVLAHFSLYPGETFYLRQLEKLLHKPVGQLRHELINLEKIQLLHSFRDGNLKKYSVNGTVAK